MGVTSAKLLTGTVMHARLFPRKNSFRYNIYYLALPLSGLGDLPIPYNRTGAMSFHDRDHGYGTDGTVERWARDILEAHGVSADGEIFLLCLPRIFGYVFNPVSFWLCHDNDGALRAVICEVHNTFGEKHAYLCVHEDRRAIGARDTLTARKVFHVSPFLEREGFYQFRFDSGAERFEAHIDYFDKDGKKQLVTSLSGAYRDMTAASCRRVFWTYPLVTFKTIALIHYQAARLVFKKIRYIPKPPQCEQRVSTGNSDKNVMQP